MEQPPSDALTIDYYLLRHAQGLDPAALPGIRATAGPRRAATSSKGEAVWEQLLPSPLPVVVESLLAVFFFGGDDEEAPRRKFCVGQTDFLTR